MSRKTRGQMMIEMERNRQKQLKKITNDASSMDVQVECGRKRQSEDRNHQYSVVDASQQKKRSVVQDVNDAPSSSIDLDMTETKLLKHFKTIDVSLFSYKSKQKKEIPFKELVSTYEMTCNGTLQLDDFARIYSIVPSFYSVHWSGRSIEQIESRLVVELKQIDPLVQTLQQRFTYFSEQLKLKMQAIKDEVISVTECFLSKSASDLLPADQKHDKTASSPEGTSNKALLQRRTEELRGFERYLIDSLKSTATNSKADDKNEQVDELEELRQRAARREKRLREELQSESEKLEVSELQRLIDQLQPTCDALRGWCLQKNRTRVPLNMCISTIRSLRPHANLTTDQWHSCFKMISSLCPEFLSINENGTAAKTRNMNLPDTVVINLKTSYTIARQKLKDHANEHRDQHAEILKGADNMLLNNLRNMSRTGGQ